MLIELILREASEVAEVAFVGRSPMIDCVHVLDACMVAAELAVARLAIEHCLRIWGTSPTTLH